MMTMGALLSPVLGSLAAVWMILSLGCAPHTNGETHHAKELQPAEPEKSRQAMNADTENDQTNDAAEWELVFSDTFDRQSIGDEWKIVEGQWKIEDESLVGNGMLISTRSFPAAEKHRQIPGQAPPGYIRFEYDVQTDVKAFVLMPGGDPPEPSASDLSSFIHALAYEAGENPLETGYFFQFGGFMNKRNSLQRKGILLVDQQPPEVRIKPDKLHKIVVENDEGKLRMTVDGQVVFEHAEPASIMGDGFGHIGLYFYTNARVHSVRVYVKRLTDGYF